MTPAIQHSLHALAAAARKGMVPGEIDMHLTAIVDEVEELQKAAKVRDENSKYISALPQPIANKTGHGEDVMLVSAVKRAVVADLAEAIERDITWEARLVNTFEKLGETELGRLFAERGAGDCALMAKLIAIAKGKPSDEDKK